MKTNARIKSSKFCESVKILVNSNSSLKATNSPLKNYN